MDDNLIQVYTKMYEDTFITLCNTIHFDSIPGYFTYELKYIFDG